MISVALSHSKSEPTRSHASVAFFLTSFSFLWDFLSSSVDLIYFSLGNAVIVVSPNTVLPDLIERRSRILRQKTFDKEFAPTTRRTTHPRPIRRLTRCLCVVIVLHSHVEWIHIPWHRSYASSEVNPSGSHCLGHRQTMRPLHESYGLFDAQIVEIFNSTLRPPYWQMYWQPRVQD